MRMFTIRMSPSMRREWIEIRSKSGQRPTTTGLPPCGGSGLKCRAYETISKSHMSPSMRREWIEILSILILSVLNSVSLHAEGVD